MALNYVRMQGRAKALIEANGRVVTLKKKARTAGDTNKTWRGPGTTPDVTLGSPKAVLIPYDEDDVDGTLIRRGDERAYIAHSSLNVDLKDADILEDGDTTWKIEKINIIKPGDTSILYEMQLRR
jgi:hypothetical protein